ncbi:Uncharacterised protein [Shigella sonnei]|nr:Uncharacterised protein [Shigella sonnei]
MDALNHYRGREATAPYPVQPSNPLPQYFTLQEGSKPVNPGSLNK